MKDEQGPKNIPSASVTRLVTYQRILTVWRSRGRRSASSDDLAREAHVSAFQVRKDLAHCGSYGTRGAGYDVATLESALLTTLGLDRPRRAAIVGMGRLGSALANYPSILDDGFEVCAAFDVDPARIGRRHANVFVYDVDTLAAVVQRERLDIALLTVPGPVAQGVTDALVAAGVRGILNFTPMVLSTPDAVHVETVDFVASLKRLAYYLRRDERAALADADADADTAQASA